MILQELTVGGEIIPERAFDRLLNATHVSGSALCYNSTMAMELTKQAKNLSISERIRLVEEIWDTIAEENEAFELTEAQKRELDRRLASTRSNPGQGRTWDEIKAEFMKSR